MGKKMRATAAMAFIRGALGFQRQCVHPRCPCREWDTRRTSRVRAVRCRGARALVAGRDSAPGRRRRQPGRAGRGSSLLGLGEHARSAA